MWIVLEGYADYHPLCDENGHTLYFETATRAEIVAKVEAQDPLVVDVGQPTLPIS